MPEFIDPVFTKTSPKRSFSLNRKRAFWLVFAKTGSIISGTVLYIIRDDLARQKMHGKAIQIAEYNSAQFIATQKVHTS